MNDRLLTIRQVMEKLQISRQTLYILTRDGKLAQAKIGRSVRYKESELERFIEAQTAPASE